MPDAWTVAIVDDDEEARLSLGSLLRSYGIKTQLFASAAAFLRSPALPTFACVITDVQMPNMDGIEMVAALRSQGDVLPVIVISALEPRSTRSRALATDADAYLTKPVSSDELLAIMQRLLGAAPD